jgi:lantibiotic biosynthesis protein
MKLVSLGDLLEAMLDCHTTGPALTLDGELKEKLERAAREIVRALPEASSELPSGLDCGSAGFALVFAYLAQARILDESDAFDAAGRYLAHACDRANDPSLSASLFSGLAGTAWVVHHLRGSVALEDEAEEFCRSADHLLIQALDAWDVEREPFDLVSGLTGIGVYSLCRLPVASGRECAERVLQRLEEMAEDKGDRGLAWPSPQLKPGAAEGVTYTLGMAHGTASIVAFLSAAAMTGIEAPRAKRTLERSVEWLLRQRSEARPEWGRFPHAAREDGGSLEGVFRTAWCNGDAGVCTALWLAGSALSEPRYVEIGRQIALECARRPAAKSGVVDAGLCHGASGLAQIFHRWYLNTADERFAKAAVRWLEETLNYRSAGSGISGYRAQIRDTNPEAQRLWDASLMMGAAGVALSLSSALSSVEPSWDRILQLSLPR